MVLLVVENVHLPESRVSPAWHVRGLKPVKEPLLSFQLEVLGCYNVHRSSRIYVLSAWCIQKVSDLLSRGKLSSVIITMFGQAVWPQMNPKYIMRSFFSSLNTVSVQEKKTYLGKCKDMESLNIIAYHLRTNYSTKLHWPDVRPVLSFW